METPLVAAHPQRGAPLAALGKLTAAALIGDSMLIIGSLVVIARRVDAMALGFALVALICAGVVMTGWRWAPLLGALLSAVMLAAYVPIVRYILSHPSEAAFIPAVLTQPLSIIGFVAGIGATVQNYRSTERRMPRWLPASLALLGGWALGAIVVGLLIAATPQAASGASVSTATLAALPALTTSNFAFSQPELRAKVGETVALRLDNRDTVPHSFDINELNVHVPMQVNQSGLALFKPTQPGSYTFYCSLPGHREKGMVGKLIVGP